APRQDLSLAHGLSRRLEGDHRRKGPRQAPGPGDRGCDLGDAAQGVARPHDVSQAEGLQRQGSPARRPEAAADSRRPGQVTAGGDSLATNTTAAAEKPRPLIEY